MRGGDNDTVYRATIPKGVKLTITGNSQVRILHCKKKTIITPTIVQMENTRKGAHKGPEHTCSYSNNSRPQCKVPCPPSSWASRRPCCDTW